MHTPSTRILSALAHDRGEEYDPADPVWPALDVPHAEQTITRAAAALRERWPLIDYVYLTPVPKARPRRAPSSPSGAGDTERGGASAR
jgi:hypothetical protein